MWQSFYLVCKPYCLIRKHTNIICVARLLFKIMSSWNMIVHRRKILTNVMTVVRSFITIQTFYVLERFILQRNLTNVMSVSKLLPILQFLVGTSKSVLKRNINLIYVAMFLFKAQALGIIREFIGERNLKIWLRQNFRCSSLIQHQRFYCWEKPYETDIFSRFCNQGSHLTWCQKICL